MACVYLHCTGHSINRSPETRQCIRSVIVINGSTDILFREKDCAICGKSETSGLHPGTKVNFNRHTENRIYNHEDRRFAPLKERNLTQISIERKCPYASGERTGEVKHRR